MKNLKELRQQKHKTQLELAIDLNLPRTKYARYESGESDPSLDTLKKIADYFDVSIDFLVGRPRPFDFPIVATEIQKQLINHILTLDDSLCEKIEAYACGLNDGKKDQQKIQNSFGGK